MQNEESPQETKSALKLSVVIPNYNHSKYLPRCISAIAAQSMPADEIIVVDDASTDDSIEVLNRLAQQHSTLKIFRNPANLGVSGALNRGLEVATSEVVYFGAADDQVLPGMFEKMLPALGQSPLAGGVICITRMVDARSGLSYDFGRHIDPIPYLSPRKVVRTIQQDRMLASCTGMLWRRNGLLKAGGFHADLRWHSDWFALFSVAFRYGLAFVPEPLAIFNTIPTSYSNKGMRQFKIQSAVLRHALELLDRPENQDIAPFFRASGVLAPFGKEMLWLLVSNRCYWKYVKLTYLRLALWWTIRIEAKRILPYFVTRLYFRFTGVSADSNNPSSQPAVQK